MSQRTEFVLLAAASGVFFKALCERYRISRKTGYKWVRRYAASGPEGLADQSRRPRRSPRCSNAAVAAAVLATHQRHPTWGGRKLRRRLQDLDVEQVPAASTCTAILRRAGLLQRDRPAPAPQQRFARERPNELWQMDFKGHFALQTGERCHPLTVLDDHSRFNILLSAQVDERAETVQRCLEEAFGLFGLPEQILCDHGSPWGQAEASSHYTSLVVWLLRLGVAVLHGRPRHPQTQGKDERFHRTLKQELLSRHIWRDQAHCARLFSPYRHEYNCERPHDALNGDTPATHYQPSPRSLPRTLPPIEYCSNWAVRRVCPRGTIKFEGRTWQVGAGLAGLPIGLRPSTQADRQWQVYFSHHQIGLLDLSSPEHAAYLPQQKNLS